MLIFINTFDVTYLEARPFILFQYLLLACFGEFLPSSRHPFPFPKNTFQLTENLLFVEIVYSIVIDVTEKSIMQKVSGN